MSLRARVLAGTALIALVLGGVLIVITHTTHSKLLGQVDLQLQRAAGNGRLPIAAPATPPLPQQANGRPTSLYVGVVRDGTVETLIAPNLASENTPIPTVTGAEATKAAESGKPFTVGSERSGYRYRARAVSDPRTGDIVVLALPIDSVDQTVSGLVTVALIAAGFILAVLALVTWWVLHLGIRPIKKMTMVATSIAEGELSLRVPDADPRTEAGELGHALNKMLGRIESAFEAQAESEASLRQFVADASHELRTPVMTIRGYAELYRGGALDDKSRLDDAMRRTEQEAIRMGSLVDDLLQLARLDQGRPITLEPVDLSELVIDAGRDASAVDPARPIETRTTGAVVVMGDEERLRQVIANVVGNAMVHTPEGTPIHIGARVERDVGVVEISDEGPGMNHEVAAHAFERFYRADPARSRHRGGTGLGLAIVEATVKAHGGTARLLTAPGQGTTVRIELPRARLRPASLSRFTQVTLPNNSRGVHW